MCVFTSSQVSHLSIRCLGFLCRLLFSHSRNLGIQKPRNSVLSLNSGLMSCVKCILLNEVLGKSYKLTPSATNYRPCWCFQGDPCPSCSIPCHTIRVTEAKGTSYPISLPSSATFSGFGKKRECWQRLRLKTLPVGKEIECSS